MKLFGIIEAVNIKSIFLLPDVIPIPHYHLFEKLGEYDSDLSVGLELVSPEEVLKFPEFPSIGFRNHKIHLDLYKHFKSKGNKIYFLESKNYFKKLAKEAEEMVSLKKKKKKLDEYLLDQSLKIDLDKRVIKYDYTLNIGKEDDILKNIAKYKPDLIFLGEGHAGRFYKNKEKFLKKGILIDEYWRDKIIKSVTEDDLMFAASASSEDIPMEDYLEDVTKVELGKVESLDQINDYPETIKIERSYKAVKEGRITDGNPHFIGTWHMELEHRGLFEMYIEDIVDVDSKDTIIGKIEDCLGSARFTGEIEDNRFSFLKTYEKIYDNNAAKEKIYFEGFLQENNEYVGKFYTGDISRNFRMKQLKEF